MPIIAGSNNFENSRTDSMIKHLLQKVKTNYELKDYLIDSLAILMLSILIYMFFSIQ